MYSDPLPTDYLTPGHGSIAGFFFIVLVLAGIGCVVYRILKKRWPWSRK